MFMNRKADSAFEVSKKSFYWIIGSILIGIAIGTVVFLFSGYKNQLQAVPPQLPAEFISLRFTNIPECFAYVDKNTRQVRTGTIDLSKFNQETLNACYRTDSEKGIKTFNFRLSLKNTARELTTNKYYNHDRDDLTMEKDVFVFDGGKFQRDILTIYVQEKI